MLRQSINLLILWKLKKKINLCIFQNFKNFAIKKLRITFNNRMLRQSINLLILWKLQKNKPLR